jgi:hypothetical protein
MSSHVWLLTASWLYHAETRLRFSPIIYVSVGCYAFATGFVFIIASHREHSPRDSKETTNQAATFEISAETTTRIRHIAAFAIVVVVLLYARRMCGLGQTETPDREHL